MSEKELSELERALTGLQPKPPTLNRDDLLFRAGRASVRGRWFWPLTALCLGVVSVCLAVVLWSQPQDEPEIRYVYVPKAVPMQVPQAPFVVPQPAPWPDPPEIEQSPPPSPLSGYSNWRLQQQAIRFGVDSLPATWTQAAQPLQVRTADGADLCVGSRPGLAEPLTRFPWGEQ
ncbi:MAG: hypothetical protein L0Y72_29865 [Gemmataceae bacterium]|nr:hypothetical protein [Gemmataceae bacterium]MCI0743255.1 hypothetical protein [Gemmataceae bacterium]